jgi:hypothetical protein
MAELNLTRQLLPLTFGSWINRRQLEVGDCPLEENRVLRRQVGEAAATDC